MGNLTRSISMMLLVALTTCLAFVAGYMAWSLHLRAAHASDTYIRDRVVKISSDEGQCSGVEITAPSGKAYVLSAGHCYNLVDATTGNVTVTLESGKTTFVSFVALDQYSDLMLLTSPEDVGVPVAKSKRLYEKIHTLTHGGGHPTYRTDGELRDDQTYPIPVFAANSLELADQCLKVPDTKIVETLFGFVCVIMRTQSVGTAAVLPGSSGGPVFNRAGALVGIVSAYGEGFNYYVRLQDIQRFLRTR